MNEYQNKLLETLIWFHDFCKENNLRYSAAGGTLLGAARHQGFIPWDDDIDVSMPRSDYETFIKLMKNREGRFKLETPYSKEKDFCYPVSKLYDTTTTVVEVSQYNTRRGVFVDIFPLDGIGNTEEEIDKNYPRIYRLNMFRAAYTGKVKNSRKWYKNIAVIGAKLIPGFILNDKKILIKLDKLCAEHDFDKYEYGGLLLTTYGKKYIMHRALFSEIEEYKFENTVICGVRDYETYLTQVYGDWRQLPPENKRISGHRFSFVDLNNSYLTSER